MDLRVVSNVSSLSFVIECYPGLYCCLGTIRVLWGEMKEGKLVCVH